MERKIIWVIMFVLISQLAIADYFYTPMNFDSPTNHSFNISLDGYVNVTLPQGFTLISGNLSGQDNLSFVIQSPMVNQTTPQLFTGTIYLNGTPSDEFYLLSVSDDKIVDTKVEVGHGDFNYIDYNSYIGTDNTLLFNIIRVWAMGSDIIGEPAMDVRFNCTYPLIIPNTVDSKYETSYTANNITAEGFLGRMEGVSMFRVFVLSQEIAYHEDSFYLVDCDKLYYTFPHTEVIADIQDINLEVRSTDPLSINMVNNTGYITYTILNSEEYDLRDLEFLWTIGTHTSRQKLDSLKSGEFIQYNIATNVSGTVDFNARFIPEWMFNSRSPLYYEQTTFDNYYAPTFFDSIDPSLYYGNQSVLTPSIFETQVAGFEIETYQVPPFGLTYQVEYIFFNDNNEVISRVTREITGLGNHIISFVDDDLVSESLTEDFSVYTIVSIKDDDNQWYDFPMGYIGKITINELTSNAPGGAGLYDVIVTTENTRYDTDSTISATITIVNTGDTPDEDTVLTYWLQDNQGNVYGETREQILEVPVGTTTLTREVSLPLNSKPGEWRFVATYETVVQPIISVHDSFEVKDLTIQEKVNDSVKKFFSGNWILTGIIIFFGLLLLLLLLFLPRKKEKKWDNYSQTKDWDTWEKQE